ncbi:MAG: DUF5053 domain-containing protein [Prevotellaceae bacterium]|jgi:hypothetical protein|nr:DUF5053 domain-containing protein [Prevotellaceae bacterium]
MLHEINKLKEDFCHAKTDKERAAIDAHMQKLIAKDADKFAQSMIESAKETVVKVTALSIRQKMKDVLPATSVAYIAKNYFKKTDSWLFQRINGNIVNGKPATFTDEELETLRFAFADLSKIFGSLSISL